MISNQEKYGWTNEWLTSDWEEECREEMRIHLEKGDPRDVAIYAMFMIYRNWSTHTTCMHITTKFINQKYEVCLDCGNYIDEK